LAEEPEVCHLTNVSVAANLANQNALGVACKAIGEAKRSLLFLTTYWNELKLTNSTEGPSSLISLSWQHSCWSNGKTLAESALSFSSANLRKIHFILQTTVPMMVTNPRQQVLNQKASAKLAAVSIGTFFFRVSLLSLHTYNLYGYSSKSYQQLHSLATKKLSKNDQRSLPLHVR